MNRMRVRLPEHTCVPALLTTCFSERALGGVVNTRQGSAGLKLKELLLGQPVVTTKLVATELNVTLASAQNAIDTLVVGGALQQTNSWKRNRIWHASEVLEALDRFGQRARRR